MGWAERLLGGLYLVASGSAMVYAAVKPDSLLGCFFVGPFGGFGRKLGRGVGFVVGPVLIATGLALLIRS